MSRDRVVQSGTMTDNHGSSVDSASDGGISLDLVAFYDQRIRDDLNARMGGIERQWEAGEQLIRNSNGGFRDGNVAAEFVKTVHARLLSDELNVDVNTDDPEAIGDGEKAEVVAQSIQRIVALQDALKSAAANASWASFGVLEVGHPIDPWSHDPWMSFRAPNYSWEDPAVEDDWVEASPEDMDAMGVDAGNVIPMNPNSYIPEPQDVSAKPVFSPAFGYPWIRSLDPRMVVMPLNVRDPHRSPYFGRLRFITRAELNMIQGFDAGTGCTAANYRELYEKVEEDGSIDLFPEMILIVELWIRRDRNNPQYNGWFISWVLGQPDKVIRHGHNPQGGMVPFIFLKLSRLKGMFDTTHAMELMKYADLYAMSIQAFERNLEEVLNDKTLIESGAGLDEPEEKKLLNKFYRGPVKVQDANGIKRYNDGATFDSDLIRGMAYVKSLAQSQMLQSEMDRGQAIKGITAKQTQALLDATGINVEEMSEQINMAATEAVMKLMHLAGLYSMAGRSRQFQFGGRFTTMSRGAHDFITSYSYEIKVNDRGAAYTEEEQLVWIQLLRTIAQEGSWLQPYYDAEGFARQTLKRFKAPVGLLASRAAGRQGQGVNPNAIPGLEGGELGNAGSELAPGADTMLQEIVSGQHPERKMGGRGLSLGNGLRGALKTGTGSGEF